MGNVAICFIESTLSLSAYIHVKHKRRIEHKRLRTLIPRYIARLNDSDVSITRLDLNGVGVDSQILRCLSGPLLSGKTRVQELYLERNGISPEAATCIARLLSKDGCLKEVSLAHNPVGSMGVTAIASALEQNTSLERLDLSYCDIDDNGIQKLAHSLRSNTTLRYINLEGNFISSLGVHSLLRCVYDTSSLQNMWESNHSLRAFYGSTQIYSPAFPETVANRRLVGQLGEILATCNRRYTTPSSSGYPAANAALASQSLKASARIAACKILRHYVKGDSLEYYECVEGMEERLIPHVVSWLVRHGDAGTIYGVVRDMPWLLEKKAGGNAVESGATSTSDKNAVDMTNRPHLDRAARVEGVVSQ